MKTFWTALIVFLATLVIAGIGGYFVIKNQIPFCIDGGGSNWSLVINKKDTTKNCQTQGSQELKTYTDEKGEFSFQYPEGISLQEELKEKETLSIRVEKIADIAEQPLGWDKETAESDILSLKYNDPSVGINFGNINTYKMLDIVGALGKEFITFGTFEVCDVQFSRYAVIYKYDYRVVISLKINDIEGAKRESSSSFKPDPENCPGKTIWIDQDAFYKSLKDGTIPSSAINKWFEDFDTIIKTFKFKKVEIQEE